MNTKGIFSHKSDNWSTPENIYKYFVEERHYYDPCPLNSKFNGLKGEWNGNVYINPPYSDIERWVRKAIDYKANRPDRIVIMLLPVRTDTKWFEVLSNFGCKISFFRGRLKFGNSKNGAPFPSMIVYVGGYDNYFTVIERNYYEQKKQ